MENTLENKKKFFALHFGQYILNSGDSEQNPDCEPYTVGHFDLKYMDVQKYLQLKSISEITDDDAIDIIKFYCRNQFIEPKLVSKVQSETVKDGLCLVKISFSAFEVTKHLNDHRKNWIMTISTWGTINVYCNNSDLSNCVPSIKIFDFLRLKGFLLPFHDLSTEQIIEYGWAKIKPNEQ